MAQIDDVEIVRMLWATARKNDVDALASLTAHDRAGNGPRGEPPLRLAPELTPGA
jgi:hypothetical protein